MTAVDREDKDGSTSEWWPPPPLMPMLRRLSCPSEELLDEAKHERNHYNAVALTMVFVSLAALVGMALLLRTLDAPTLMIMLVAPLWGGFILSIDYLVISSVNKEAAYKEAQKVEAEALRVVQKAEAPAPTQAAGGGRGRSFARTALRLLLAISLGLVIGESVVLTAFNDEALDFVTDRDVAEIIEQNETLACRSSVQLIAFRPATQIPPFCDGDDYQRPIDPTAEPSSSDTAGTSGDDGQSTASTTYVFPTARVVCPERFPDGDPVDDSATSLSRPLTTTESSLYSRIADAQCDQLRIEAEDDELESEQDVAVLLRGCEANPDGFTQAERAELNCTGDRGPGSAFEQANADVIRIQNERDSVADRLQAAVDAEDTARSDLATLQISLDGTAATDSDTEAKAAETAEQAAATEAELLANSEQAVELDEDLRAALAVIEEQTTNPDPGRNYGVSDIFEGVEKSVNGWIKWGLRLVFIIVDMTPVLMKMSHGPTQVDAMVAVRSYTGILPHLQDLHSAMVAYVKGEDVRPILYWLPDRTSTGAIHRLAFEDPDSPTDPSMNGDGPAKAPEPEDSAPPPPVAEDAEQILLGVQKLRPIDEIGSGMWADVAQVEPVEEKQLDRMMFPWALKKPRGTQRRFRRDDEEAAESRRQLMVEAQLYQLLRPTPQGQTSFPEMIEWDPKVGIVIRHFPRTSVDRWFFSNDGGENLYSTNDLVRWMGEVSTALKTMWSLGHAHGDGKPANLLIGGDSLNQKATKTGQNALTDKVVLCDFGGTGNFDTAHTAASPGYVPPEFWGGDGLLTPLSDIYSWLGGTFYYLATGGVDPWFDQITAEPPSPGAARSAMDVFYEEWGQVSRSSPITPIRELNSTVPSVVADRIMSWLSPDPSERLGVDAQRLRTLEQWDVAQIGQILDAQVRTLASALDDLGQPAATRNLGRRHTLARDPIGLPLFSPGSKAVRTGS